MKGPDGSRILYYVSPSTTKAELILGKMACKNGILLTEMISDRFYIRLGFLLMKTEDPHQYTTSDKLSEFIDRRLIKKKHSVTLPRGDLEYSFILTQDDITFNEFMAKWNLPSMPSYPENTKLKDLYRFFRYNIPYSEEIDQRYKDNVRWVIDHCTIMFNYPSNEIYSNMDHKTVVCFNKGSFSSSKLVYFNEESRSMFEINNTFDKNYSVKDVLHLKANTLANRIHNTRIEERDNIYKNEIRNITPWCFLPQDKMIQLIKDFIPDHDIKF